MKDYTNGSPVFRETIRIPETTDPANADTVFNVTFKALQDNVLALKSEVDEHSGISLDTKENVEDMADELMGIDPNEGGGENEPSDAETATDEDIEDLIDNLDDL